MENHQKFDELFFVQGNIGTIKVLYQGDDPQEAIASTIRHLELLKEMYTSDISEYKQAEVFPVGKRHRKENKQERNDVIRKEYHLGMSQCDLAQKHGITRARVSQIIRKHR